MNKLETVESVFTQAKSHFIPVTACYHFGQQHQSGRLHAELELEFYRYFQPDILKVMNDYAFPMPKGLTHITKPDQVYLYDQMDLSTTYGEQLTTLRLLDQEIGDEVVLWDTVFNPWFAARRHIVFQDIDTYMEKHPEELHYLLQKVTDTLIQYMKKSLKAGARGFLYSVPASKKYLSRAHYQEFMKPYDLQLIKAMKQLTNMFVVHLHGDGELYYEDVFEDYDFDGMSWSDRTTNLSLAQAKNLTDAVLMGGVNECKEFNYRPYPLLEQEIEDAMKATQGHRFILAPGCVLQPQCPSERLTYYFEYAKKVREKYQSKKAVMAVV